MEKSYYVLLFLILFPTSVYAQSATIAEEDSVMESEMKLAWAEIREYFHLRNEGKATDADDPQPAFAEEFFRYYREHPDTPTGKKAGEAAFMMWGNLGAAASVDEALPYVPADTELWARILNGIGNAYARQSRRDAYVALLLRLEDELTHPKSRSELLLRLSEYYRREQPEKAKTYLEEVVRIGAHPFDVQKAESELYEMESLNVGQIAPDFTAETIDGTPLTLSDLRRKVVLLEFWATTCGPCLPEIPHLKALQDALPPSDFQIIGVTQDDDLPALRQFMEAREMTWPQVRQTAAFEGERLKLDEVLARYNVYGIPRSFLIGRDGRIVAKDLRGKALEEAVHGLMAASER